MADLPSIPLQFGNLGNALAAGAQARYASAHANKLDAEERRINEAQPYVEKAMQGDVGAMGKVAAGNPQTAVAISAALSRMDANQRAQTKEQAEYAAHAANAILQANPQDRPAVYAEMYGEGQRRGYKMTLPPTYSPQLDGILRSHREAARNINDVYKQMEGLPQPMGPPGGGVPAAGGAPAGGPGAAIASMESGGQPNGGYGAVGPVADNKGSRAYGKYQVMDFNIGPWTQEVLGKPMTPQEFAANPQAQDAVFNAKFGQYVQKFGSPQAAARAWFAGEGGMNNPGASDVNGTTVAGYERKFNTAMGGAAPGTPGPIAAPPQVAQGDTPQADASGTPQPPAMPDHRAAIRGIQLPPGARVMGVKGVPIVKDGTVAVLMPDGSYDFVPLPQRRDPAAQTPPGFRWANGQPSGALEPIPGGPQDPNVARRLNVPPGYQPSPTGNGLAPIPGGPADPEVITRTAESKRIAAEKAIPQTVTKGMQENVNSLKQLDRVEAELAKVPDSVGGAGSTAAAIIPGVGALQNRFGDPQGTQLRALIADIGSMKIHDRSGAAVTASEFPRLRPFIPTISDDAKTVRAKLANFRAEYTSLLSDTASYYGPENGFRAYGPAVDYLEGRSKGEPGTPAPKGPNEQPKAAPAAAAPATRGSLKLPPKIEDGATATNPQTGERIIFKGGQWGPAP